MTIRTMNTRKQTRRESGAGENDGIRALFEEFSSKTSQTILQNMNIMLERSFEDFEKRLDQKLDKINEKMEVEIK